MPEKLIVEASLRDVVEVLLLGAIYDEANDTEQRVPPRLEDDRTLRIWNLLVGSAGGRERLLILDTNRIQWTRPYDGYITVPPVLMTNVEGDLWAPGGAVGDRYAVQFNIVNIDNANAYVEVVTLGHAVGGGAIAANEYIMRNEAIPIRGATGWRGPYVIAGNDTIRGNTAAVNDAAIHFRVRRVDAGA